MFLALGGLILLLGAAALLTRDVVRIKRDLSAGQGGLGHLQLTQLDSRASIEATVGTADRQLRAGANLARDSIWLKLLAPLPKVGPQIKAARVLSGSAAHVGDIAYQAAIKARTQLDAPRSGPAARLHLVDALRQDMIEVNQQLDQVPTHTDGHLATSLAKARAKLIEKLAQAKTQLNDGITLTATLRTMLAGPRTYLVLAGNNAEMRSGGITTAAGLIHFEGGDLSTGEFISSFDLFLPDSKKVPVPDDINRLYGWMQPGQEWRTTDTSPNWPVVAKIYSQMSANSAFGKVDGVLFVDVVTLRAVLRVVGPVTVNGFKYSADNVVAQVLYRNYLLYPTADQTNARRDVQSNVARAAFTALRSGAYSIPQLAHALDLVAKGRHLLAWSADPAEEAMWVKLGADGALGPDKLMVSVQNVSASKLDVFITPIGVNPGRAFFRTPAGRHEHHGDQPPAPADQPVHRGRHPVLRRARRPAGVPPAVPPGVCLQHRQLQARLQHRRHRWRHDGRRHDLRRPVRPDLDHPCFVLPSTVAQRGDAGAVLTGDSRAVRGQRQLPDRRRHTPQAAHLTQGRLASWSSNHRLTTRPQRKPPRRPSPRTTRWQGTNNAAALRWQADPTARAAPARPQRAASSP